MSGCTSWCRRTKHQNPQEGFRISLPYLLCPLLSLVTSFLWIIGKEVVLVVLNFRGPVEVLGQVSTAQECADGWLDRWAGGQGRACELAQWTRWSRELPFSRVPTERALSPTCQLGLYPGLPCPVSGFKATGHLGLGT